MSDTPRSEPSTEPRGLRLPYGPPPGAAHPAVGQLGRLRSQLITTAVIAGCVIVVLAAAGFGTIAAKWYPPTNVAYGVAGGTVLVGILAALRVYVLFRALEKVPAIVQLPPALPAPPPPPPRQLVEQRPPVVEPRPPVPVPAPALVGASAFTEGIEQWGDVFGKLSRRLQSLVNRLIRSIDRMEHELEDPDLLDMLWAIDHLATLVRRQAENIAVLGGETLERRSDTPVDVNAVLRSSVAEIQRYRQVVTIPIRDARIHGHVVAEIIHLLSELLDNATTFSPDDAPKVAFRAQYVTAGLAVQVQDRGIGMDPADLRRINHLLDHDTQLDVGELFKDGRIGLAVVKELARRHNIGVEMQPNIYGGIDASIVVPHQLLDSTGNGRPERRATPVREAVRETTSSQPVPAHAAAPAAAPQPAPQPAQPAGPLPAASYAPPKPPRAPAIPPKPLPQHTSQPQPVAQTVTRSAPPDSPPAPAPEPAEPAPEDKVALPVRERGTALAAVQAGKAPPGSTEHVPENAEIQEPPASQERPPLPNRRERQSYLRPELRQAPVLTRPIPGHSPDLLADLQLGRVAGQEEINHEEDPTQSTTDGTSEQPQRANERDIEGEKGPWPTI
jgi:hypothetical protein